MQFECCSIGSQDLTVRRRRFESLCRLECRPICGCLIDVDRSVVHHHREVIAREVEPLAADPARSELGV